MFLGDNVPWTSYDIDPASPRPADPGENHKYAFACCPVDECKWAYFTMMIPPMDVLMAWLAGAGPEPGVFIRASMAEAERITQAHLETHTMLQWAQTVQRLQGRITELEATHD